MNYKPFVSWEVYGAATSTETAHYFASFGLYKDVLTYLYIKAALLMYW